MDLGLSGKRVLVTGSWRGTGAAIAESLAREGARVLVHGLEPGQNQEVCDRLNAQSLGVVGVTGDITHEAGSQQLIEDCQSHFDGLDVLVNNYGVAEGGDWTSTPSEEWVGIYQKNVLSGVRLVHGFAPGMREQGQGRIIFVGTVGSLRPNSRMPHYYASKAVLPNLCVSLARELRGTGITVNVVSPGVIGTREVKAMLLRQAKKRGWGEDEDAIARAAAELFDSPLGRIAEVEEVAAVVAFVASNQAGYINGSNIRVDGGASDCAL